MGTNGSPLLNPTTVTVTLAIAATGQTLAVTIYPDLRTAPDPGTQLTSALVMLVLEQQQRLAALEVLAAELARDGAKPAVDKQPFPNDRARDDDRAATALNMIGARAAMVTFNAPQSDPTANGGETPDEPSDDASATGSALDSIALD